MIRHVFLRRGGLSRYRRGGSCRDHGVSPYRETATVSALPIPLIEASGGALLMALTRGTQLLRACLRTAHGAAIPLPAITGATQKEARSTRWSATKALAERLRRRMRQHRSRLAWDRQRLRVSGNIAAMGLTLNAARGRQPKTAEPRLRLTTGVLHFVRTGAEKEPLPQDCACGDDTGAAILRLVP